MKPHEFDLVAQEYEEQHRTSIALSGETPEYFARLKVDLIEERLPRLKLKAIREPEQILDFGCGVGNLFTPLRRAFPNALISGADPSSKSLEIAGSRHRHSMTSPPNLHLIQDGFSGLPTDQFDLIVLACVIHHVDPVDRDRVLAEVYRLLKPSGTLWIFEHNPYNPMTLHAVKQCEFDRNAKLVSNQQTRNLLRGNGFAIADSGYMTFFPAVLKSFRPLENYLRWFLAGAQHYVVGTKKENIS